MLIEWGEFRLATAYAITKALLPLRLMFSVWATPGFARLVVVPIRNGVGRIFTRGKRKAGVTRGTRTSAAAGTGAVGAGVIAREAPATVGSVRNATNVRRETNMRVKDPP